MKIINYKEGMTIQAPCAIRGMPIDVYHSHPALSESGLKTLLDCPARYYYKYLSGNYEYKEKPSFKIGKACHKYILEGQYFDNKEMLFMKKPVKKTRKKKETTTEEVVVDGQTQS